MSWYAAIQALDQVCQFMNRRTSLYRRITLIVLMFAAGVSFSNFAVILPNCGLSTFSAEKSIYEKNRDDANYSYKFACTLDDLKKTVKLFDKCISYKSDADLFQARANCLWDLDQKEAAIRDWTDAINLARNYWRLYHERANAYLAMNNLSRAISDFEAARRLCHNLDNESGLNLDYAEGLVKVKRYDEALKLCERVIATSQEEHLVLEQANRMVSQIKSALQK